MYVRLYDRIWSDPEYSKLNDKCKLAFLYFFSCKHHNIIGLYRLPIAYICADMGWDDETVTNVIFKLRNIEKPFIDYEEDHIFIYNYLKYNPLGNPNQVKGAISTFIELEETKLHKKLLEAVKLYDKGKSGDFIDLLESIGKTEIESPKKVIKKVPKMELDIDHQKTFDDLLKSFGEAEEDLKSFLETLRLANITKKMSLNRAISVLNEIKQTKLPVELISQGARAAINAGVANVAYLIKVAKNKQKEGYSNEPSIGEHKGKYSAMVEK